MSRKTPPLLGIAAYSGTGKTTLLKSLIPLLQQRQIRVGLIKHTHHNMEIDTPVRIVMSCVRPVRIRPWLLVIAVGH